MIVEDDNDISRMLKELLEGKGYETAQAYSGTEALLYVEKRVPDGVILDLMLPGMDGEEVLKRLKEISPHTAVLVSSAKEEVQVRISLLKAGADDYLVKPFDTQELLARLEAVLRRLGSVRTSDEAKGNSLVRDSGAGEPCEVKGNGLVRGNGAGKPDEAKGNGLVRGSGAGEPWEAGENSSLRGNRVGGTCEARGNNSLRGNGDGSTGRGSGGKLEYRGLVMYPEDYIVKLDGRELSLTKREFLILQLLLENPGKVFTKSNIYESVWNEEFLGEDNAVNVHISNIRQKIAKINPEEKYIQTVWGIGFKL